MEIYRSSGAETFKASKRPNLADRAVNDVLTGGRWINDKTMKGAAIVGLSALAVAGGGVVLGVPAAVAGGLEVASGAGLWWVGDKAGDVVADRWQKSREKRGIGKEGIIFKAAKTA